MIDDLLCLHTDDAGQIWQGVAGGLPEVTGVLASRLSMTWPWRASPGLLYSRVRVLGGVANAHLISQLGRMLDPTQHGNVQVGNPHMLPAAVRQSPEAVLMRLSQLSDQEQRPGAWHRLTHYDVCTHQLLAAYPAADSRAAELVLTVARQHPAWPAFTFVPGFDPDRACQLLCTIVDPRWFSRPDRPQSLSRLYAYLGLTRTNVRALAVTPVPQGLHHYAFTLAAVRSWYNDQFDELPRYLQIAIRQGKDWVAGLLRATRRFLALICHLCAEGVQLAGAFDPELFFSDVVEAKRFIRHCAAAALKR